MGKYLSTNGSDWWWGTERVSDGWVLSLRNKASFPAAFFVQGFRLTLRKESQLDPPSVWLELLSEPLANPDDAVVLKFKVAEERAEELRGSKCVIAYGTGVGQYELSYSFEFGK